MRILLVEDNDLIAELLAEVLTQHQYVVNLATDGHTAWQLFNNVHYDLILLDLVLPDMDGIQLCRRFRSQTRETPILMLSAHHLERDRVAALAAGANDYLVKPFELKELLARIQTLLMLHCDRNTVQI